MKLGIERCSGEDPDLTVGRLRELIENLPEDLVVVIDGCDCREEAGGLYGIGDDGKDHTFEWLLKRLSLDVPPSPS